MHAAVDVSKSSRGIDATEKSYRASQGRGNINSTCCCSVNTSTTTTTVAPTTTLLPRRTKKRKCQHSTSSQHFPDRVGPIKATPSRRAGVKWRSGYFASSPDSCAGSAASFDWGSAFTERAVTAFRSCPKFEIDGVRHLCKRLCYLRAYEVGCVCVIFLISTLLCSHPAHPDSLFFISPNREIQVPWSQAAVHNI